MPSIASSFNHMSMITNIFTLFFILNGFLLSVYLEKKSFCMLGMISDIIIFKGFKRFKEWVLIIIFGIIILQLGARLIYIDNPLNLNHWNYLSKNADISGNVLLSIIGGFIFGMGMTLASGCGLKQIMRLGKLDFSAIITLITLSFGAFFTKEYQLREMISKKLSSSTLFDFTIKQSFITDIMIGIPFTDWVLLWLGLGLGLGIVIVLTKTIQKMIRKTIKDNSLLIISFLFSSFILLMFLTDLCGVLPQFSQNMKQPKIEGLSFVMPICLWFQWLLGKGNVISGAMWGIIGIILGSFYTLKLNEINQRISLNILIKNMSGGFLMGIGGVIAMGCTIGQGVSALLMLAPSGLFTLLGLFLGVRVVLLFS